VYFVKIEIKRSGYYYLNTRATENAWEIESSMKTCKSYFYGKCFVDKQNDNEVTIQPYYGDRMRICKKMLVLKWRI